MEYKSVSFRSNDRDKTSDPRFNTPSRYRVTLDRNDLENVKEIRLGTIELPRTQYIVEEGYNELHFTEGFKLGLNGLMYTDPSTGDVTEVRLPNYLNKIIDVIDVGPAFEIVSVLPWNVTKYFAWKEHRESMGHVVPDLVLLGANTGDPTNPVVVLTKENFIPAGDTIFQLVKTDGLTLTSDIGGFRLFLHRAPWHIPEMLDFINFCLGKQLLRITGNGKFEFVNYVQSSTSALQFIVDEDEDNEYADGLPFGLPEISELPFRIEGDNSTSGKVAPKMTATLPVGDYTVSDMANLLPQFMSLGNLTKDASFDIMVGLQSYTVVVPAGMYSSPFLLNEAVRLAIQASGAGNFVDCEYDGSEATEIFMKQQFELGKFRFFSRAPFMLDFSRTTLELANALNVDGIQYGPTTLIQSKDNIVWPNFLGVLFNTNIYEMSSTIPASQRFCIKAFNPNPVTFTGTAEVSGCVMYLRGMDKVLPFQSNDVCYFKNNGVNAWLSTARVYAMGYIFELTVLDFGVFEPGRVVVQDQGNGKVVYGIAQKAEGDVLTVYTAFSTENDQFKTEFPIYYEGVQHQVLVCENCKELGLVLMVGCHVPDGVETTSFTCGFIDAPRFEMESLTFNDESRVFEPRHLSVASRIGVPDVSLFRASVGNDMEVPRMSGSNFYLMPDQFNFDPMPYILLFLKVDGNNSPDRNHEHQGVSGVPLAKLIMQTPYTVTRHQIMELSGSLGRLVKQVSIEFRTPDGALVNFHGREHSMTLGFVIGRQRE